MKRQNYFTVRLLTKPYLKKYLHHVYGQTIYFTTSNYFGDVLAALLSRPDIVRDKRDVLKNKADRFDTELLLFCPVWFLKEKKFGHYLSDKHVVAINKLFEDCFTDDLFRFCTIGKLLGANIEDCIYEFCKIYNIEIDVDITFDALKQKEYRYREELRKNGSEIVKPLKRPIQLPLI